MTRHQEIRPVLEEGIDRKVLGALRARFLSVNAGRLERARLAMSPRQQLVLKLLPLLFHVNHPILPGYVRSEEHTSELQSLMRISYAVFCLKKKNTQIH